MNVTCALGGKGRYLTTAAIMSQVQLESECLEAFKQGNKRDAERLLPQIQQPATVRTGFCAVIVNGINIYIASMSSLLHLAAVQGWMDVVIDLITKYKCDANCKSNLELTPLHYASEACHLEVVRYFINEQHCDPNDERQRGPDTTSLCLSKWSPQHCPVPHQ